MSDESDLKGLVVVVIALILGVLFLGVVWTNSQPPSPTYATYSRMLKPDGDFSLPPPNAGNWTTHGCAEPNKYQCIDENPHDGNTSYIVSLSPDANAEMFQLENLTVPAAASIDQVTVFAWMRGNTTGTTTYVTLDDWWILGSNFLCLMTIASPGLSFANHSESWALTCNDGAWNETVINGMILIIEQGGSDIATVTMAGAVIEYSILTSNPPGHEWDLVGLVPIIFIAVLILIAFAWWSSREE